MKWLFSVVSHFPTTQFFPVISKEILLFVLACFLWPCVNIRLQIPGGHRTVCRRRHQRQTHPHASLHRQSKPGADRVECFFLHQVGFRVTTWKLSLFVFGANPQNIVFDETQTCPQSATLVPANMQQWRTDWLRLLLACGVTVKISNSCSEIHFIDKEAAESEQLHFALWDLTHVLLGRGFLIAINSDATRVLLLLSVFSLWHNDGLKCVQPVPPTLFPVVLTGHFFPHLIKSITVQ